MNSICKIAIVLTICISTLFLGVGYAELSNNLDISGFVNIDIPTPTGIYITNVEVYNTAYINTSLSTYEYFLPTNLKSNVTASRENAYITYAITVYNNSNVTYWYLGIDKSNDYGTNNLIGTQNGITIVTKDHASSNSDAFDASDWVPPMTERTFYATYNFGKNASLSSLLVNFKFGLHMDSVQDSFLKILNDKNSQYGYYYLADAFDTAYSENSTKTIGNVGKDAEVFDNLFGPNLTINVDGVNVPVTVMVTRENVDNNLSSGDAYKNTTNAGTTGCEYTVYITVDDLDNPGSKATVYAVSYTCKNGVWYMIGELYEGTATIQDYQRKDESGYEGSFDTGTWIASEKEYHITDNISYWVGRTQVGTEYDRFNEIEELMGKPDNEIFNKINNNSSAFLKKICNILYSYRHQSGSWMESINELNRYNPGYDILLAAFEKIKPYCQINNGAQDVRLADANKLTRAELIPLLESLQNAYDYYRELNPGS